MTKRLHHTLAECEPLESRALLAVDIGLAGDVLRISGDNLGNRVEIALAGTNLEVRLYQSRFQAQTQQFPTSSVRSIEFNGNDGSDLLRVDRAVTLPVIANGGRGFDVIWSGGGNDSLTGGEGSDVIFGGDGDDRIDGGPGADLLDGNSGNDLVIGGAGNDALYGVLGNDSLFGDSGNDRLIGGDGNDELHGGSGRNFLNGGPGPGTDVIFDGDPEQPANSAPLPTLPQLNLQQLLQQGRQFLKRTPFRSIF